MRHKKKTEKDFLRGYCGTYALAMHDLSSGKLKLGMVRGSREDEDVNVHSFVFHPKKKGFALDASGVVEISDVESDWLDSHLNPEQMHLELDSDVEEYRTRDEFLRALKETGHPEITEKDYADAVNHINRIHDYLKYKK